MRSTPRWIATACALLSFSLSLAGARAGGLTLQEKSALARGEVVKRKLTFELDEGRYVGGVAYVLIQAPVRDVMSALLDVRAYTKIFPLTAEARAVGRRGKDPLVSLKHWTRVATAEYTVRVQHEGPALVRFWRDKDFHADVDDCWGFFRATRIDADTTMLTYGALMNLGFGIARIFFESKIQGYALEAPDLVRRYVEGVRPAP